jgi:hypothetical protein
MVALLFSWQRLPQEGPKAFAAFLTYRDLGPERSHRKAAAVLKKSVRLMNYWSSRYSWWDRTRQYDDEQARLLEVAKQRAYAKFYERRRAL